LEFNTLLQGLIAGYGIAIPIGPIAILIIEFGIRRGVKVAWCAGLGAASADLIYATIAMIAGTFLAQALRPYSGIIRIVSASALIVMGMWLLYHGTKATPQTEHRNMKSEGCFRAYGMILTLTLLNPITVTYFTSLILGLRIGTGNSIIASALFVVGAFSASLSWQSLLACTSGLAHKRLSPRLQKATFALGNSVIILLGIMIVLGLPI
jgi:arginine exporter protein ArgO